MLIPGDSVGRVHDAAGVGIVGRRDEGAVGNAVQQPLVFERNVPDQSEAGLGLRVRPVVEAIVRDRGDDAEGRLYFVFEIGDEKISYSLGLCEIHRTRLYRTLS